MVISTYISWLQNHQQPIGKKKISPPVDNPEGDPLPATTQPPAARGEAPFTPGGPWAAARSPINPAPSPAGCSGPLGYWHWLPAIKCPLDFLFLTFFFPFSWHCWFLTLWGQQLWLAANAALGCNRQPHAVAFLDTSQASRAYLSLSISTPVAFCFLETTIKIIRKASFLIA